MELDFAEDSGPEWQSLNQENVSKSEPNLTDGHQQIISKLKKEIEILERKVSYLSHFKSTSMEKIKNLQQDKNTLKSSTGCSKKTYH